MSFTYGLSRRREDSPEEAGSTNKRDPEFKSIYEDIDRWLRDEGVVFRGESAGQCFQDPHYEAISGEICRMGEEHSRNSAGEAG